MNIVWLSMILTMEVWSFKAVMKCEVEQNWGLFKSQFLDEPFCVQSVLQKFPNLHFFK